MMRPTRRAQICCLLLIACSSGRDGGKLRVGKEGAAGADSSGFQSGSTTVSDAGGADAEALGVRVMDIGDMSIEILTLACAQECADVKAVAHGGNPPYAFEWEDGSTNPARHVCLDTSTTLTVTVTDTAIEDDEFPYVARSTSIDVTASVLDCAGDAGVDGSKGFPPPTCDGGDAVSADVMGVITHFDAGATYPAGRYRIAYLDGCMKYGPPVGWSIHNLGVGSWYAVGETTAAQLGVVPGVAGLGSTTFEECVAASRAAAPLEFDFNGGKIGVWLFDMPYTDNVEGEAGRNPSWCLTRL